MFFFKQKTAYEMRISDWSSDVCSSDLGRRRPLFSGEFIAALKMIDTGVPASSLKGSWAGATGGPQFLPSVFLRLARDGDGDGRIDIWNSEIGSASCRESVSPYE